MQRYFLKIVLLICLYVSSNLSYAQTDWGRLLSGTIKAGQAMIITDEELANIVREQVAAMDKANLRLLVMVSSVTNHNLLNLTTSNYHVYASSSLGGFSWFKRR